MHIQRAIAEFDKHNGKGSHRGFDIAVTEDDFKWNVHFERKGIGIPGHHSVVFVYKNSDEVEYSIGE